ncbi:MAG: glucose 1-dehydrogenase [Deltaproteobacteria bacterium]|nr:glucose 1-dehydrogenase [Deltaproteobacteria bacterium]
MAEGRLAGKIALVTGAAKGQGAAVSRRFAAEGARLALLDVLDDTGRELASAIEEDGGTARYWHCDVGRAGDVEATIGEVVACFGGLDVLYNNAAVIAYGRRIGELSTEDWERTLAINLNGPFFCTKFALPHLLARGGGSVINVSSHGAFQAAPVGIADYGTSKGGLVTFTHYLASEYGREGVRANCIAPGPIPTDLNALFLGTSEGRKAAATMIPLGRVGDLEDIANAAVFLASDESRWITGTVLHVDGGIVIQ